MPEAEPCLSEDHVHSQPTQATPVQVVVLEKGRFTPAAELSLKEREAGKDMYEMGTLLTTTDAGGSKLEFVGGSGEIP